jgi:hypothetical protein
MNQSNVVSEMKPADLVIGGDKSKRKGKHKPTLAGALRQAAKAGAKVVRAEIGSDGKINLVFGANCKTPQ